MSKVKIQTSKGRNFGQTINFGGLDIKFDKLGYAEVASKEIAGKLQEDYPGWLFVDSVPKETANDLKAKGNEELAADLLRTKNTLETREATIKALEAELVDWKEQIDLQKVKITSLEFDYQEHQIQNGKIIEEMNLNIELLKKPVKELNEICVSLEIPEESYKTLPKDDLIKLILGESRN